MPLPCVLLTGFEPFANHAVNSTAALMEAMASEEGVVTAVLPVEYDTAPARLIELLELHKPIAVAAFGMAPRSDYLVIERIAWNRDESVNPDNAGVVREDQAIVEDGPTAYGCSVHIPTLMRALAQAGLPVSFGDHAGGHVNNHLFYAARHHLATQGPDIPMVFLHVPPLPEQIAGQAGRQGLALDRLLLAARTVVDLLRQQAAA